MSDTHLRHFDMELSPRVGSRVNNETKSSNITTLFFIENYI